MSHLCYFCDKNISIAVLFSHTAACYYNFGVTNGISVLCTCSSCMGVRTHDFSAELPSPKTLHIKSESPKDIDPPKKKQADDGFPLEVLLGKQCACCETRRAISQCPFPFVRLGQFRTIKICKKNHLTLPDDMNELQLRLENEMEKIKKNGD
eukprot:TRINITY_DN2531_c0_g2_i3.p1 TRINITY_DN2531_c0_g2~~TRINITY_DN2531_c0_g2_i3.p1  ORF type:complete len:152 (-),score=10.05 TRINITY_DN2531_c0_g2_i3:524-979(-)